MRWQHGDVILWREVWRGRPWLVWPARVVEDTGDRLALYLAEGTPLGFPAASYPWDGGHPWSGRDRWEGHGLLALFHAGAAHAVWVFWEGPRRELAGWYLNLCRPFERTERGIDTLDHELDIWIEPSGRYRFKDDEKLDRWIELGRWSAEEVEAIRDEGARLAAELDAGRRWWSEDWAGWEPDALWDVPELPAGWDA